MNEKHIRESKIRFHTLKIINDKFYNAVFHPKDILLVMKERGYEFRGRDYTPDSLSQVLHKMVENSVLMRAEAGKKYRGYIVGKNFDRYYAYKLKNA